MRGWLQLKAACRTRGRGLRKLGQRPHHVLQFIDLHDFAPRHAGQFFHDFRPRRAPDPLGSRPARRTTPPRVAPVCLQNSASHGDCLDSSAMYRPVNSPHSSPAELEPCTSSRPAPEGCRDSASGHLAAVERLATPFHHVGVECPGSDSSLGLVRHVIQPHRLALGHIAALIGHPAAPPDPRTDSDTCLQPLYATARRRRSP